MELKDYTTKELKAELSRRVVEEAQNTGGLRCEHCVWCRPNHGPYSEIRFECTKKSKYCHRHIVSLRKKACEEFTLRKNLYESIY